MVLVLSAKDNAGGHKEKGFLLLFFLPKVHFNFKTNDGSKTLNLNNLI